MLNTLSVLREYEFPEGAVVYAKYFSVLPVSFWLLIAVLLWGLWYGVREIRSGLGLPVLAVVMTVSAWYVGDALYNDYTTYHAQLFTTGILSAAWWQVVLFCAVFLVLTPVFHDWMNAPFLRRGSYVVHLFRRGIDEPGLQHQTTLLFRACAVIWICLALFALARLRGETLYYFLPFLGYRAEPWARGRVGGGIDFILVFVSYLHLLVASCFGLVAALTRNKNLQRLALAGCAVTWPYIFFGSARNYMLTAAVPGILAWALLRSRARFPMKLCMLAGCFILISLWLSFVIASRSTTSIVAAAREGDMFSEQTTSAHHEGLNMYEELCWINSFIEDGIYQPNWGRRYFAEIVNPIPRTLWKGKPMIGIDYAVARGQGRDVEDSDGAGVYATISTGMIGQGVVNFDRYLGPAFAGFLMALWAVLLARLDLTGHRLGRVPLFGIGLLLTFNLGRDITLITLYPFVFGVLLVWVLERREQTQNVPRRSRVPGRTRRLMPRRRISEGKASPT